jgi:hypothetical protein
MKKNKITTKQVQNNYKGVCQTCDNPARKYDVVIDRVSPSRFDVILVHKGSNKPTNKSQSEELNEIMKLPQNKIVTRNSAELEKHYTTGFYVLKNSSEHNGKLVFMVCNLGYQATGYLMYSPVREYYTILGEKNNHWYFPSCVNGHWDCLNTGFVKVNSLDDLDFLAIPSKQKEFITQFKTAYKKIKDEDYSRGALYSSLFKHRNELVSKSLKYKNLFKSENPNIMKTVTLKAAIQDAISYMGDRSFSIEDVYKLVKSRFENGELSFIGVVTTDGAFPYKYNSFKNDVLAVIALSNDYNVVYGPKYRTFNKKNLAQAVQTVKTIVKDAAKKATATNSPVVTAVQNNSDTDKKNRLIVSRFNLYVKNIRHGGLSRDATRPVSVKRLQSAFKQEGWTCQDINSALRARTTPTLETKHVSKNLYKVKYL